MILNSLFTLYEILDETHVSPNEVLSLSPLFIYRLTLSLMPSHNIQFASDEIDNDIL
jgi:hypothetical protein